MKKRLTAIFVVAFLLFQGLAFAEKKFSFSDIKEKVQFDQKTKDSAKKNF